MRNVWVLKQKFFKAWKWKGTSHTHTNYTQAVYLKIETDLCPYCPIIAANTVGKDLMLQRIRKQIFIWEKIIFEDSANSLEWQLTLFFNWWCSISAWKQRVFLQCCPHFVLFMILTKQKLESTTWIFFKRNIILKKTIKTKGIQ